MNAKCMIYIYIYLYIYLPIQYMNYSIMNCTAQYDVVTKTITIIMISPPWSCWWWWCRWPSLISISPVKLAPIIRKTLNHKRRRRMARWRRRRVVERGWIKQRTSCYPALTGRGPFLHWSLCSRPPKLQLTYNKLPTRSCVVLGWVA